MSHHKIQSTNLFVLRNANASPPTPRSPVGSPVNSFRFFQPLDLAESAGFRAQSPLGTFQWGGGQQKTFSGYILVTKVECNCLTRANFANWFPTQRCRPTLAHLTCIPGWTRYITFARCMNFFSYLFLSIDCCEIRYLEKGMEA